jgi:uncharacterized protein YciI
MENRKEFIYTIKPTRLAMLSEGATAAEETVLSQHFNYLQELTNQGTVLMAARTLTTGPETFGIVIFYAQDDAEAQVIMDADPAVAQGVMQAALYPFRIALMTQSESGE